MRLQVFTAPSPAEAMTLVRAALGDEAIIVRSEPEGDLTRITATVVGDETLLHAATESIAPIDPFEAMADALDRHGVPPRLSQKLEDATLDLDGEEAFQLLSGAFAQVFRFSPIEECPPHPLMLVGPPGSGKTVAIAKLAARALMAGCQPSLVTTDTVRAGGIEQLESLCRLMRLKLERAPDARQLARILNVSPSSEPTLIDTGGINPYRGSDLRDLRQMAEAANAEPVLVMPGGIDVFDSIELAAAFAGAGVTRFIATRLDLVSRLGSLLAMADATGLAFSEASATPAVAGGLAPLNAEALARLVMPES